MFIKPAVGIRDIGIQVSIANLKTELCANTLFCRVTFKTSVFFAFNVVYYEPNEFYHLCYATHLCRKKRAINNQPQLLI